MNALTNLAFDPAGCGCVFQLPIVFADKDWRFPEGPRWDWVGMKDNQIKCIEKIYVTSLV